MAVADWRFNTPAWEDDERLPKDLRDAWHQNHVDLATQLLDEIAMLVGGDRSLVPYVNPVGGAIPESVKTTPVPWDGFPEAVTRRYGGRDLLEVEHLGVEDLGGPIIDLDTGEEADVDEDLVKVRDRQDEYLEWHEERVDGVLTSVTFVCEGYDYYGFLFDASEAGRRYVVDCYRHWTGDDTITDRDLEAPANLAYRSRRGLRQFTEKGKFNPRNRFNREAGIVHLSHMANSLEAEVALAVTSSLPRHDAKPELVSGNNEKKLMCCTLGGDVNRSSDPKIAAGAYKMVTDPHDPRFFTLTNPVGLYIRTFEHAALQTPGSTEPAPRAFWTVQRGVDATDPNEPDDARILRLRVEPVGVDYRLGDMNVDGESLEHAGQLAKLIGMHLLVDHWPAPPGKEVPSAPCEGGCCIDEHGIYAGHRGRAKCPDGSTEAFPGLVGAAPSSVAPLPAPAPARLARRR